MTTKKSKFAITFCVCFILIAFAIMLGVVNADTSVLDEKVDVTIGESVVVIDGADFTCKELADTIFYGNINLNEKRYIKEIKITLPSEVIVIDATRCLSNGQIRSGGMNFGLQEGQFVEGFMEVRYQIPGQTMAIEETMKVKFVVKANYRPVIKTEHIYIAEDEFATMSTDAIVNRVIENASVFDPNGREDLVIELNNTTSFEVGVTSVLYLRVEDYNKTVVEPAYVTIVSGTKSSGSSTFENARVRNISEEYFPYFRDDIKKVGDKYVAQRAEDGYLYFLNTSNTFLTVDGTPDGKKYPVAACLTTIVEKNNGNNYYYVTPISKWVNNGICASLLTGCFEDTDEYIQSWTFDEKDIYTIRQQLVTGRLDDNFYENHYANGYCKDGTKSTVKGQVKTTPVDLGTDGLQWYVEGNTLYITAKDIADHDYTYRMPDEYEPAYTLSEIKEYAVANWKSPIIEFRTRNTNGSGKIVYSNAPWIKEGFDISKIVLDDKITYISKYAFAGMTTLTEMPEIPANCARIGEGAFFDCMCMTGSLKTKYVAVIEPFAFANCQELHGTISLGDNAINTIGEYAFYSCGFSESLKLPASLYSVGDYAFANCSKLTGSLILSSTLSEIGEGAFMNCSGLDGDLNLNCSITTIKPLTFANCSGFNGQLSLPESVITIGDYAFVNCKEIMGDLYLPNNLEIIGVGAFRDCESLKSTLVINDRLKEIGTEAFMNCVNITTINNKKASAALTVGARAFIVDKEEHGIVSTTLLKKTGTVFSDYTFLADKREILNY